MCVCGIQKSAFACVCVCLSVYLLLTLTITHRVNCWYWMELPGQAYVCVCGIQ
jgi:hypothetical protein